MRLDDFDYELPPELIARFPAPARGGSRLLVVGEDALTDSLFERLPQWLRAGDLLVFNDTRVIKARLHGAKASGGRVEVLVERVLDERHALAQVRASKSPKPGAALWLADAFSATVVERRGEFFLLRFDGAAGVLESLERHGETPLPPYIDRPADEADEARYQTVYAREPGAVAAPTAGLHFDEAMLERLHALGIAQARLTLHVGAGTFQPVRVDDVLQHRMHSERYAIPAETVEAVRAARERGGSVVAVGTTSLRALEAAAAGGELVAGEGETDLFITPGYRFRVVDRLLTNFHLPRSTLLMLVCAFAGHDRTLDAYRHAVAQRYHFFSYGDAMLLTRSAQA